MRVLFLGIKQWPANSGIKRAGGSATYCDLLIKGLNNRIECLIITQKSKGQKAMEVDGKVTTQRIPTIENRVFKLVVGNFLCTLTAYRLLKKKPVDVINAHTAWAAFFAYFLGRILNIPLVITPQGDPYGYFNFTRKQFFSYYFVKLIKLICRAVFPKAASVVLSSPEELQRVIEHTNRQYKNIDLIETGMSLPELPKRKPLKNRKIRGIFVGRLTASKGVDKLLLALAQLDAKLLEILHVDILGDGEDAAALKQLCADSGLDAHVTFHGFVEHSAIGAHYAQSDIFIFPSLVEGFSLALLEAMSYGLACVVNDYGLPFAADEILRTPNNEPESIAAALTKLLQEPHLIQEYGANARNIIEEKYSVEVFAQKHIDLFNRVSGKVEKVTVVNEPETTEIYS